MQRSIFDGSIDFKIDKPIRLIELFGGYGSQHFALEYLGADFEQFKLCEWAVKSIQAYKDAHCKDDNTDYSKDLTKEQVIQYLTDKGISSNYNEPMTYEQVKRLGEDKARTIYNNIQATHNLVNIQQAHANDFDIVDTDNYCYVMTYSFPCQDLSKAGLGKGMEKGSGTRSGMLWEVERILDECEDLPQVLVMENVPDVIGTNNIKHFASWLEKLESLGYKCYYQVLNAKNYGVPQNRERCFMVSVLGDYYYSFPQPIKLEKRLKDLLEDNVDEKYYLSEKSAYGIATNESPEWQKQPLKDCCRTILANKSNGGVGVIEPNLKTQLCNELIQSGKVKENDVIRHSYTKSRMNGEMKDIQENNMSPTLDTRCDYLGVVVNDIKDNTNIKNVMLDTATTLGTNCGSSTSAGGGVILLGYKFDGLTKFGSYYTWKNLKGELNTQCNRTANPENCALTVACAETGKVLENNYRIRKLTPKECFRLMGVKDCDFENIAQNQSNASLYHLAGDSIVVDVLMNIFKQML